MSARLELHGFRHDLLGHPLKVAGLFRVLDKCADGEYRDPSFAILVVAGIPLFQYHRTSSLP
mgnify:CR=1 FL=1